MAGGIHLPGQNFAEGIASKRAGRPDPKRRFNRRILVQKTQLHSVSRVDHDDDILKIRADAVKQSDTIFRELQRVKREVRSLHAVAANDNQRRIGICFRLIQRILREVIDRGFIRRLLPHHRRNHA
ncbi:hypothetical protein SDC9_188431 [bioreactor metagenome]|uniref:Uncharacterized protein n=1 Tax=bioreactor metagenome TaxID=1076179 RepID=A0A645HPA5_9ZZZZ